MIIDTKIIEKAIFCNSAPSAAELCNLPAQTIRQYRSAIDSKSYRDWQKMSLIKAKEIMKNVESKKDLSES